MAETPADGPSSPGTGECEQYELDPGKVADGDDSEFGERIYVDTFRVARSDP